MGRKTNRKAFGGVEIHAARYEKNAICPAKNEFFKLNYLKNLFQYNRVKA